MTALVEIIEGTYKIRGKDTSVAGLQFKLVEGFKVGAKGGYITVDGRSVPGFPERNIKIAVPNPEAYTMADATPVVKETDEEIIERLRKRFEMLEKMTAAAKKGAVRAMIVSGPPGVGKSFGIEKVLGKHDTLNAISGSKLQKYEVVKGSMSAIGLYCKLYNFADKDNVLVFDDCDDVFEDVLSLNILKAALDSKKVRKINWNTDSRMLRMEGIPDSFEFKGSVIFVTNAKFDDVKSKKLKAHLEALESRCHYMDLTIDTDYEKMLRIKQITRDGMLEDYGFHDATVERIVEYIEKNKTKLRELSLRTVLKVADLVKGFPEDWEALADNTVLKRSR